ncbi:MAG: beta-ketoacyl-[acyl-carrier-protein] synthase family protein [Bacteroidota bacterium]
MEKRVVVTGLGIVTSNGGNVDEFSSAIKAGKSGIKHVDWLEEYKFSCQVAGIPDVDTKSNLDMLKNYLLHDSGMNIKYGVTAAMEAWNDAKLEVPDTEGNHVNWDTGAIIGSGMGNIDIFTDKIIPKTDKQKVKKIKTNVAELMMFNAVSANLEWIFALGNMVSANASACSTGTESVIMGAERIRLGKAKRMLVGATEIASPYIWGAFDSMFLLDRRHNHLPEKASRPMSASAGGFVPCAGAGMLVLEDYELAKKRNAPIYGEIKGYALNSGGQRKGGTMQSPGPEGVKRCIQAALNDAQVTSTDIDFIAGHLSATKADPLEIKNWSDALHRKGADFPYINSLKSLTGHGLGAAGSMELVAALLQLKNQFIHPSINCEDIHPEIEKIGGKEKIPQKLLTNVNIKNIAKASFGFGDLNSCVILSKL